MAQFVYPSQSVTIPDVATETTLLQVQTNTANTVNELQSTNTFLSDIYDRVATQTTLASVDSKVLTNAQLRASPVPVSGPLTDTQLRATAVPVSGPLTDTELRATAVSVSASSLPLPTGAATESTLSSINSKTATLVSGRVPVDGSAVTQPISASSLPLPTGAATQTTLANVQTAIDALNARVAGSLVPEEFDYQDFTYVPSGNGVGEIATVVYKLGGSGGTTVATLSLSYDGSNRLSSVTRS